MTRARFLLVGAGAAWLACALVACSWFDSDLQRFGGAPVPDATTDTGQAPDAAQPDVVQSHDDGATDAPSDVNTVKDSGQDVEDAADANENDAPVDAGEDAD